MDGLRFARVCRGGVVAIAALAIGFLTGAQSRAAEAAMPGHVTPAEASLLKADDALLQADVTRDLSVIQRGFADEAHIVHANGEIQTKSEYLRMTEAAKYPIRSIAAENRLARIFGNVGVVHGRKNFVIELTPGQGSNLSANYLAVYLKRDGRWQLLELHQIGAKKAATPQ